MLNLFESNMLYESAAFITLIILVINLSLRYITYLYRKTELLAVNSIRGIDGSSCQKSSPGMSLKRNTPHFLRKAVKALRPSRWEQEENIETLDTLESRSELEIN